MSTVPDPKASRVIADPILVERRLRQLSPALTGQRLMAALGGGLAQRANVTLNHPRTYAGNVMYGETTRSLRDIFLPLGWERHSVQNFETVSSPDGSLAIVVASGDAFVGHLGEMPTTRHAKGFITRRIVRQNRQAHLLFDATISNARIFSAESPEEERQTTWFLLHCIVGDDLCSELSQPTEIDESGLISEWHQRLILPRIPMDADVIMRPEDEPIMPIVEVRPRAG